MSNSKPKIGCGSGLPCIYVGPHKWIPYEDTSYKNYHPPPIKSSSWKDEKTTLFIMIASFRDKLCPVTLFNLYTKAKYPDRIFIGLVEQTLPEDGDCLKDYCDLMMKSDKGYKTCPFTDNIRVEKKDASKALVSNKCLYYYHLNIIHFQMSIKTNIT